MTTPCVLELEGVPIPVWQAEFAQVLAGPPGAPGAGLHITGQLPDASQLPATAQPGDAYLIAGDLHVWISGGFVNVGPIQGPPGPPGHPGQIRYTGLGPPPAVIVGAEPGDTYLDLDTGDIYKLT